MCIYLLEWYIRIHRITIITFSKNRWVNLTKKVFHIDFRVLLIFKKYHFSAFRNPSHASCEYQFPVGTKSENCLHFYLQKCVKNVEKMPVSLNRINSQQASAILVVYVVILIDRRIVFQWKYYLNIYIASKANAIVLAIVCGLWACSVVIFKDFTSYANVLFIKKFPNWMSQSDFSEFVFIYWIV